MIPQLSPAPPSVHPQDLFFFLWGTVFLFRLSRVSCPFFVVTSAGHAQCLPIDLVLMGPLHTLLFVVHFFLFAVYPHGIAFSRKRFFDGPSFSKSSIEGSDLRLCGFPFLSTLLVFDVAVNTPHAGVTTTLFLSPRRPFLYVVRRGLGPV